MAVNLYRYLPTFIRIRDRLASGLSDEDTDEAVLEKLCGILASTFDETDDLIKALIELGDPDDCDPRYFMHISYILGTLLPTGGDETKIRFIIKHLVDHYKTKGTHHSWMTAWHWQEVERPRVVELWKSTPNEVGDYTFAPDAAHPLKSARIDLTVCATSCETLCESACETFCEETVEFGTPLSRTEAVRRLRYVDDLRPIHVLLRREAREHWLRSGFPFSYDTLAHYPMPYDRVPDVWEGSYVEGDVEDNWHVTCEDLVVDVECYATCETACQGCCEVECECDPCQVTCQAGSCEQGCTASCQTFCEFTCEHSCQFECTVCMSSCTGGCQGVCTGLCEGVCTASCQSGFATICCQAQSCQVTCTVSSCQTQCQGDNEMVQE